MIIGGVALGLLVVGWLVVSFSEPSPRRVVFEWISAAALYGVLTTLFSHLVLRAQAEGSTVALVAFGFLLALFASGMLVTLFRAFAAMLGGGGSGTSATN